MRRTTNEAYGFSISENHWINLWDYGWFEVASYHFKNYESEENHLSQIITSFIANPFYHFTNGATEGLNYPQVETHGPFWANKIQVNDYVPITRKEFLNQIDQNFKNPKYTSPPEPEQLQRVNYLLKGLNIENADYYKLNIQLDDEKYRLDFVFHNDFFEYIIINQAEKRLHICVISYD